MMPMVPLPLDVVSVVRAGHLSVEWKNRLTRLQ